MSMSPIVLHVCCAPCASACLERLALEGFRAVLFFSNANIAPRAERDHRLHEVFRLAKLSNSRLEVDDIEHETWLEHVAGLENAPEGGERCQRCFAFNLERTRRLAEDLGLPFTTSLTVSPHKSSAQIFEAGGVFPGFQPWNFKKRDGFKRSLELSRHYGFYRQNYCGCEFSRRE